MRLTLKEKRRLFDGLLLWLASAFIQIIAVVVGICVVYLSNLDLLVTQIYWVLREAICVILDGSFFGSESWIAFPDPIFINRLKITLARVGPLSFYMTTLGIGALFLGYLGWLRGFGMALIFIPVLAFPITRQLLSNPYMFAKQTGQFHLLYLVVFQSVVAALVAVIMRMLDQPRLPKV